MCGPVRFQHDTHQYLLVYGEDDAVVFTSVKKAQAYADARPPMEVYERYHAARTRNAGGEWRREEPPSSFGVLDRDKVARLAEIAWARRHAEAEAPCGVSL